MMPFYVKSSVKLNMPKINTLKKSAVTALEQTTDALLTEVKNAEVMPFKTGNMQNESTFTDYSNSSNGVTSIITSTPYARRLYYHPEYNFNRDEHKNAMGEWLRPWLKGGSRQSFCHDTFIIIYRRLNRL